MLIVLFVIAALVLLAMLYVSRFMIRCGADPEGRGVKIAARGRLLLRATVAAALILACCVGSHFTS